MKRIFRILGKILFVLLIILVVISVGSKIMYSKNPYNRPSILGFKNLSVRSGSMEPNIKRGDLIILKKIKWKDVKLGDVITYTLNEGQFVTHRVVEKEETYLRTKGDANNVLDEDKIGKERIVGVLFFRVPKGGYISEFIASFKGIILFIFIPLIIILINQIKEEKHKSQKLN